MKGESFCLLKCSKQIKNYNIKENDSLEEETHMTLIIMFWSLNVHL